MAAARRLAIEVEFLRLKMLFTIKLETGHPYPLPVPGRSPPHFRLYLLGSSWQFNLLEIFSL
jgi:hypothetical protein